MAESPTTKSIVAGVDGSRAAIRAALWAVDEAVSRDVPLRLRYAIERGDNQGTAEAAVRQALNAIQATGKPVKTEEDVVRGHAVGSLIGASASAAMVCVGAVGSRHFQPGRVGSTAAALAVSAHCPVAIVRGGDDHRRRNATGVAVEVGCSSDNGVLLGAAIDEALVRGTVQVVVCRPTAPNGTDADHLALADLDRRLARWKRRYPGLRVEVAVHVGLLEYVTCNPGRVGVAIAGAANRAQITDLVGPRGNSLLQAADCSLLIVNRRYL